jgi:pimeloyl-ACP methyl ester carboxylesterase
MATKPSRSGHLPINGLSLYYGVYGELGKSETSPLLLIPGGFMATDSMKSWVSAFAGKRAVIVFDQQGHGRVHAKSSPRPLCTRRRNSSSHDSPPRSSN